MNGPHPFSSWPEGAPDGLPVAGSVDLWAWPLEGPPAGTYADESALSDDEIGRANRFCFADIRRRFVAARLGLRGLLAAATGVAPGEVAFRYAEYGKPSLEEQGKAPFWFNLTHSGDYALAAFSVDGELGVDIELHRPCKQADSIARRHFTPAEAAALRAAPGEPDREPFFNLWTAKEAVIKLLGSGLSFPLTAFETPAAFAQAGWIDLPEDNPLRIERCWLEPLDAGPGYSGALASVSHPVRINPRRLALA